MPEVLVSLAYGRNTGLDL